MATRKPDLKYIVVNDTNGWPSWLISRRYRCCPAVWIRVESRLTPWMNELWRHRTLYVGFSLSWPVNRLCGILFNRFYRLEIHSLSGRYFRFSLWTVAPMDDGTILYLCTVAPLPSLWPPPPSPPFSNKMYSIYRRGVWLGWGEGLLKCTIDRILQEFYLFLTRFRTYKIVSPPQIKMTKDDIKGLVSLKFLRSWLARSLLLSWRMTHFF